MHEYGYEQGKLWKKRWNNTEMLLNINMQTECLKKGGWGYSLPRAPVVLINLYILKQ